MEELRHRVDQARAADAHGTHIAPDHLQLDGVAELHAFNRPFGGAHTAADLAALERGSGGRGSGERALRAAEDDLPVRADVYEHPELVFADDAGRQHAGDDVRTDVSAEGRQCPQETARTDV